MNYAILIIGDKLCTVKNIYHLLPSYSSHGSLYLLQIFYTFPKKFQVIYENIGEIIFLLVLGGLPGILNG